MVFDRSIAHDLISVESGFAEEDPKIWWESVKTILGEIVHTGLAERVVAIGVTGMVPTLILLDAAMNPIRNSIQQNDTRAIHEIEMLKERLSVMQLKKDTLDNEIKIAKRDIEVVNKEIENRALKICNSLEYKKDLAKLNGGK
jgi:xylulokinase